MATTALVPVITSSKVTAVDDTKIENQHKPAVVVAPFNNQYGQVHNLKDRTNAATHLQLQDNQVTPRPRVVHFSVHPDDIELMQKSSLAGYNNVFVTEPLTAETAHLAGDASIITTFVHDQVSAEVLEKLPHLTAIAQRAAGFDNIDMKAATHEGIRVYNVPEYANDPVAEYAFGLMLGVGRKIFEAHDRTSAGNFSTDDLRGRDLSGNTLVVVGGGRIGMSMVEKAVAAKMKVLVVDPFPKPELAERLGFEYAKLEDALPHADFVSLHTPLTPQTHHLFDADAFNKLKDGAIFINTARGGVVDTAALIAAIESGKVSAAALDTFEGEKELLGSTDTHGKNPLVDRLLELGVVLTPHAAYNSHNALDCIHESTAESIAAGQWGGLRRRVGSVPRRLQQAAEKLFALSDTIGEAVVSLDGRRALGNDLEVAWIALQGKNEQVAIGALDRLADRCKAMGLEVPAREARDVLRVA